MNKALRLNHRHTPVYAYSRRNDMIRQLAILRIFAYIKFTFPRINGDLKIVVR
jgi:hypothetical protein